MLTLCKSGTYRSINRRPMSAELQDPVAKPAISSLCFLTFGPKHPLPTGIGFCLYCRRFTREAAVVLLSRSYRFVLIKLQQATCPWSNILAQAKVLDKKHFFHEGQSSSQNESNEQVDVQGVAF